MFFGIAEVLIKIPRSRGITWSFFIKACMDFMLASIHPLSPLWDKLSSVSSCVKILIPNTTESTWIWTQILQWDNKMGKCFLDWLLSWYYGHLNGKKTFGFRNLPIFFNKKKTAISKP